MFNWGEECNIVDLWLVEVTATTKKEEEEHETGGLLLDLCGKNKWSSHNSRDEAAKWIPTARSYSTVLV